MAGTRRIDDAGATRVLADYLNGNARRRPVVVVTSPAARDEPWIDVDDIAREAGELAEVYLMPTGDLTWEFSRRMPAGTQVYGGAGRAYPVGHAWATDVTTSPLRFAFNAADGVRATKLLTSDALRMAVSAGLLRSLPSRHVRSVSGTVLTVVAGRALVDIGQQFPAVVAEELTADDVPIENILVKDQRIDGSYDSDTNRIDITGSLRSGAEALRGYSVGDVVLTKVAAVGKADAELLLYPRTDAAAITARIQWSDVTTNPLDDLDSLMTVGEVIPARVVTTGPQWSLVLKDVDDNEPVVPAPALVPGGPAWLSEDRDADGDDRPPLVPPALPAPLEPGPDAPSALVEDRPPVRPVPTMVRRRGPGPVRQPPAPAAAPDADALRDTLEQLRSELAALRRDRDDARLHLLASAGERDQLRYLLDEAERRATKAARDLKSAKARLRRAGKHPNGDGPRFADAEQGFRYLVVTRWATRTAPGEQGERPLPDFAVGPQFIESLTRLEGVKAEKVADVVFEIVTGLAPQLPGREIHRLRTGTGGEDAPRTRADGAVAWRASLQVHTPSARRLHYWVLPDGTVELARVARHDDYDA